jgi:hypothetical protein
MNLTAEEFESAESTLDSAELLSILVGNYEFVGPISDVAEIAPEEGLLAILIDEGNGFELVDLYETSDLQQAARTELSKDDKDRLSAAVHYTAGLSPDEILSVKEEILAELDSNQEVSSDQ